MVDAADLARILDATAVSGAAGNRLVRHLLLDSRLLAAPSDACFFAIKGLRHDGHRHIAEMHEKGVRVFVVQDIPDFDVEDSLVLQVADTVAALQALAAHHRRQFDYPVVGITGSNGKTTVKEWMAHLAAPLLPLVKSPRSFNSQVGVPLSVWQMQDYHKLALFEAGISTTDEMERLANVIKPTIGIFTHLGAAHDAGFTSRAQKFEEKWKLFANAETIIYHADGGSLSTYIEKKAGGGKRLVGWQITRPPAPAGTSAGYRVGFDVLGRAYLAILPFADDAGVENALHAATALLVMGLDERAVLDGLATLRPLAMRLEWKEGLYGSRLLDDSYNNDLDGLQTAVQQLSHYGHAGQKRVLIVSDLPEAGSSASKLYARAAEVVRSGSFEKVYGVGPVWRKYADALPDGSSLYEDTDSLMADLEASTLAGSLILMKGGRAFGFERVVLRLQKLSHGTRLEVDLSAIAANLNYYRAKLPTGHKVMAMVKAGAYGAGSYEIASTLAYHKVDYLAVAYADEAVELRNHAIALPIMVMNAVEDQFDICRRYGLEPALYSLPMLKAWLRTIAKPDKEPAIHLEMNTGMNRLGFDEGDMQELMGILSSQPKGLRIASAFSHLAAADDPAQDAFSRQQIRRYTRMAGLIAGAWGKPFLRHIANTAGASRLPGAALDMVRLGIGLYGVEVGSEGGALQPVGRLKSVVSQVRTVPAGESVSYGHRWLLESPKRIATVSIGYADGLSRKMGNGNFALRIRGGLAPTVGNICMDMTMVDVTHLPAVQEMDEAIIFDETNRIEDLARIEGTIPYEILTRLSERVRRIYVSE